MAYDKEKLVAFKEAINKAYSVVLEQDDADEIKLYAALANQTASELIDHLISEASQ